MKKFQTFLKENNSNDYLYHGTSDLNVQDILRTKKLKVFKPDYGTEQNTWPDGSTKKRSYWTSNLTTVSQFYPDNGKPVVLRTKKTNFPFKQERYTQDYFLEKDIGISKLEIRSNDAWISLTQSLNESTAFDLISTIENATSKQDIKELLNAAHIFYKELMIDDMHLIIFDHYVIDDFSFPEVYDKEEFVERNYDKLSIDFEEKINSNFWKNPMPLYHATPPENVDFILEKGLLVKNKTRAISNRFIQSAIFTMSDMDLLLDGVYGSAIFAINTPAMKRNLVMPFISKEPLVIEKMQKEYLAHHLELKDYEMDLSSSDGIMEDTFILHESISPIYLILQPRT